MWRLLRFVSEYLDLDELLLLLTLLFWLLLLTLLALSAKHRRGPVVTKQGNSTPRKETSKLLYGT